MRKIVEGGQVVFLNTLLLYISKMNVGNINSSVFFYTILFGVFIAQSVRLWKENKILNSIHILMWLGLVVDQLTWVNGDLGQYLKHYDRDFIFGILIIYWISIITIWVIQLISQWKKK